MPARPKRALVYQHLENISRQALERYEALIRNYVRGRRGIYALYRKGKLYYVGSDYFRLTSTRTPQAFQ